MRPSHVATVALGTVTLAAGSVSAAQIRPPLSSAHNGAVRSNATGWIQLTFADKGETPLQNPHIVTVTGRRDKNGNCGVEQRVTLQPGQRAVEAREVAVNTGLCEMRFEVGTPSLNEISHPSLISESREAQYSTRSAPNGIVPFAQPGRPAFTEESAGYMMSWYHDPINYQVNYVKDNTVWHWNGSSVLPPVYNSENLWWLTLTGWYLASHNWFGTYNSSYSESYTYADFQNGSFCSPYYTDTNYEPNLVAGYANGTLYGYVFSVLSGYCTELLSFQYQLVRTFN